MNFRGGASMTSTILHTKNELSARPRTSAINVNYYERMAGAVGGPLLALYGLTRGTPAGLVLAAGGSFLFYRSLTGHCPVYQAAGVTTARGASERLHAEKSV